MGFRVRVTPTTVLLVDEEAGSFLVGAGEIVVHPLPAADPAVVRLVLLGPAIAILLQLRGQVVLHGSAVEVDGRAAVFAGDTGAGKSTTAAALVRGGAGPLVDDVVGIEQVGGVPVVAPGPPHLRLMPESLLALGDDPASLPRLRREHEKRLRAHPQGGTDEPVRLGAVYLVEVDAQVRVEHLTPAHALGHLLRQSYCADLLPPRQVARHFVRCAALAAAVPVSRLGRPQALGRLEEVAVAVRQDLAAGRQ